MIQPNAQELAELSNGDLIFAVKLMSKYRCPTYVEEELLKRLEQLANKNERQS